MDDNRSKSVFFLNQDTCDEFKYFALQREEKTLKKMIRKVFYLEPCLVNIKNIEVLNGPDSEEIDIHITIIRA